MKQANRNRLITAAGIALLATGLVLLKCSAAPKGALLILPYICIGLGCGAFGNGLSGIVSQWAIKKDPDLQKQIEIDQNDERNIAISNRAKAKAYDVMLYVFGALMLVFALLEVDIAAVLLLVCVYLFVVGTFIFYLSRYHREM